MSNPVKSTSEYLTGNWRMEQTIRMCWLHMVSGSRNQQPPEGQDESLDIALVRSRFSLSHNDSLYT